jgi:hypothetical protein
MRALFRFAITAAKVGLAALSRESISGEESIIGEDSTKFRRLPSLIIGIPLVRAATSGISPASRAVQSSPLVSKRFQVGI